MKFLWLLSLIYSLILASQTQIIVGTYSNVKNATKAQAKLEKFIKQDPKFQSFYNKHFLTTKYKADGKYFKVVVEPFKDFKTQRKALKKFKLIIKDAYAVPITKKSEPVVKKFLTKHVAIKQSTKNKTVVETKILEKVALDIDRTYNNAIDAYKANDFATSYELFSKLYLSRLSDTDLNFDFGRSAYETGHYEVALAAFERVEMLDPTNLRNRLEKARTYFMLKMYEDAELSFREVLENPMIPKNVRKNIEFYLSKVTGVQQKSFTYATINLDWIYDSNVNYASIDDSYSIGTTVYPTTSEHSDRALQFSANIVNIYDIGEANGFAIKNRALLYLKDFSKENAYDVQYLSYTPSLVYKYTKYSAEMLVGLDTMTTGKELLLKTIYYMPRVEYRHTNTLKSTLYFKYQRKFFQQTAQSDLNSNHYELSYGLQDILSPRSFIQSNLTAIQEKKQKGIRTDVDYREYKLNAIYAKQFTATYGGELYAQIRKRTYSDYDTLFNSTRDDISKTVSVSLNAKILQTLSFRLKALYDRVDSNQNVFSYQKYTVSAGIVKTF